ncbi:hypothetical protein ACPV4X_27045, partial [Vibrio owensii]|uniref:hypothetical protein n=1 Tax=Vibrio owensii TaxID=696485 RepID=UPI004067A764
IDKITLNHHGASIKCQMMPSLFLAINLSLNMHQSAFNHSLTGRQIMMSKNNSLRAQIFIFF